MVEILCVMAIMAILLFLVVPVSSSLQETGNLAYAGQTVADELAVARQDAASLNQTVYVRFIIASGSAYGGYNAIQIYRPDAANPGQFIAVDRVAKLPNGIEISANTTLSPLVSTLVTGNSGAMPSGSNVQGNYVYFTVRPNGNVIVPNPPSAATSALAAQPSFYLTILSTRYDSNTTLPKNYVTVQVNPNTANTQVFRP